MFDLFNQPMSPVIHQRENNEESQALLREVKVKLSEQCHAIFLHLMSGASLTTTSALYPGVPTEGGWLHIGDLRRRIKDLKDHNGVAVSCELMPGGFKRWYMSADDKLKNKGLL